MLRRILGCAIATVILVIASSCVPASPPSYGLEAKTLTFATNQDGAASGYFELTDARTTVRLVSLRDSTGRDLAARVTGNLVNENGNTLATRGLSGLNVLGGPVLPPTVLYGGFSLKTDTPFVFEFDTLTDLGLSDGRAELRVYLLWWELLDATGPFTAVVEVENPS